MDTITIKLPRTVHRRLQEKARKIGRPKSELVREAIESALDQADQPSCYDLMKPAIGHCKSKARYASVTEGFNRD